MSEFAQKLADALNQRRSYYEDLGFAVHKKGAAAASQESYAKSDLKQMVDGLLSSMISELLQNNTEERAAFVETVIASLLAAEGYTLSRLVRSITSFLVLVTADTIVLVPEEARGESARWLANFSANLITETIAQQEKKNL